MHWVSANPDRAALLERLQSGSIPDLAGVLPTFEGLEKLSTRQASGEVINALAAVLPELWGGSADLAECVSSNPQEPIVIDICDGNPATETSPKVNFAKSN
jgi:transketolase